MHSAQIPSLPLRLQLGPLKIPEPEAFLASAINPCGWPACTSRGFLPVFTGLHPSQLEAVGLARGGGVSRKRVLRNLQPQGYPRRMSSPGPRLAQGALQPRLLQLNVRPAVRANDHRHLAVLQDTWHGQARKPRGLSFLEGTLFGVGFKGKTKRKDRNVWHSSKNGVLVGALELPAVQAPKLLANAAFALNLAGRKTNAAARDARSSQLCKPPLATPHWASFQAPALAACQRGSSSPQVPTSQTNTSA